MFTFDMPVACNYASFFDRDSGRTIHVDSFDNVEFTAWETGKNDFHRTLGTFTANSDKELNDTLSELATNKKCQSANKS